MRDDEGEDATSGPTAEARREEGARVENPRLSATSARRDFHELHSFYDQMCPPCAELNYAKREQTADLRGRVALVTGARVKIGYQAAVMLLRAGAEVIVATRFPRDAARRFGTRARRAEWMQRLHVYGIDLRHTPSVELLAQHLLQTQPRLDAHHQQRVPDRAPAGGLVRPRRRTTKTSRRTTAFERAVLDRNRALLGGEPTQLPRPAARSQATGPVEVRRALAGAAARRGSRARRSSLSAGPPRSGSAASRHARLQLLAHDARRRADGRAARGPPRQRGRAVRAQRAAAAAARGGADARCARRQRVGDGRPVLPALEDRQASAHEHGEGRAQHDDADVGGRLRAATAST